MKHMEDNENNATIIKANDTRARITMGNIQSDTCGSKGNDTKCNDESSSIPIG